MQYPVLHPTPIATVKVASDWTQAGWIIINEEDFDPEVHVRFDEKPQHGRRGGR